MLFNPMHQEKGYSERLDPELEPELKYPTLWTGLLADLIYCSGFLSFFETNKRNLPLYCAIAVQARNIGIKN